MILEFFLYMLRTNTIFFHCNVCFNVWIEVDFKKSETFASDGFDGTSARVVRFNQSRSRSKIQLADHHKFLNW